MLKVRHTVAAANKYEALTMTETMTALPDGNGAAKRRREKFIPKPRPVSRDQIDNRRAAAKRFEQIVSGITAELGGNLTIRQKGFVEALAGCRIDLDDYIARRLLGQVSILPPLTLQSNAC